MKYTKNDIMILGKMADVDAVNKLKSCTVNNIIEKTKLSNTKIRAAVKTLLSVGLIDEGYMQKNAKTYYITAAGLDFLKELGCPVRKQNLK